MSFRKLRILNQCSTFQDLRVLPANKLEALSANSKGPHSIRINDQWRICFKWLNRNAYNVKIVDYDLDVAQDTSLAKIKKQVQTMAAA